MKLEEMNWSIKVLIVALSCLVFIIGLSTDFEPITLLTSELPVLYGAFYLIYVCGLFFIIVVIPTVIILMIINRKKTGESGESL